MRKEFEDLFDVLSAQMMGPQAFRWVYPLEPK